MTPSPPPGADSTVEALTQQALAARHAGRLAQAAMLFGQALAAAHPQPRLLLLAGETLYRLGLLRSAEDALTAARSMLPADPGADLLLGRILQARGQPGDALAAFERVTAARPEDALAWRFQATAMAALGHRSEAQALLAKADQLQQETAEGYNEFGISALAERRPVEAELLFRQALALAPGLVAAWQNLGPALASQDRLDEAIDAERRAVGYQPNSAAGWTNLGAFANAGGRFREARQALQRACALAPGSADTLNNLANLRLDEGDAAGAQVLLDNALRTTPTHRSASDNWLLTRNYIVDTPSPADWLKQARNFAALLRPDAPPLPHHSTRDARRRLRIGFVSADFRRHSCASFLGPLFSHWHHGEMELFAYSDNIADDEITLQLKAQADVWCPVAAYGDIALAERVSDDRIDILVDLGGHMAGNRLPAFALRPAPVQVSWLGYPDTSGLDAIDYRLTDSIADPPGKTDALHSETLWRLPHCFLAFRPDPAGEADHEPDGNGVVFGSFNHLPKVTPAVVAAWARMLTSVPESRLVLKAKRLGEPETRDRYLTLFAAHGIEAGRLDLVGWRSSPADHLSLYRRVDIALDPFPYNGTTTTCEALAMGVPVVTLAGGRHASRVGASLLTAVGLEALVTTSVDDYVACSATLAQNAGRRRAISRELRAGMLTSPLCDAERFAGDFAAAMRGMWKVWCEKGA